LAAALGMVDIAGRKPEDVEIVVVPDVEKVVDVEDLVEVNVVVSAVKVVVVVIVSVWV
jgi:hypothetical protein